MSRKSILIINEDRWLAKTLGRILEENGYEIHTAKNGMDGIKEAEINNPDLITVDVGKPQKIEADIYMDLIFSSESRNVPVIFISNDESHFETMDDMDDYLDDWISKPFNSERLLHTVYNLIGD